MAYDVGAEDGAERNLLLNTLKEFGVNAGGSGSNTVRLRPCLTFTNKHVDLYTEALQKSINKIKN